MSKNSTTYSQNGSKTTVAINKAPYSVQLVWKEADENGAAIIRVRSNQTRYDTTSGKTFHGVHQGLVSVYTPRVKPEKKLWFKKLLGRTETNPSMQILEVPHTSYDIEDILRVVNYAAG